MHRLIVTSATYRQSSRLTSEHRARDLENRLYSPGEPVPDVVADPPRLGARCRRGCSIDGSAAARSIPISPTGSGRLSPSPRSATSPIRPPRARTSIDAASTPSGGAPSGQPTCSTPRTGRPVACVPTTTSTPLHALTTLNDPTWVEAARVLGRAKPESRRLTSTVGSHAAFRHVLCRPPTERTTSRILAARLRAPGLRSTANDKRVARALLEHRRAKRDETLDLAEHAAFGGLSGDLQSRRSADE